MIDQKKRNKMATLAEQMMKLEGVNGALIILIKTEGNEVAISQHGVANDGIALQVVEEISDWLDVEVFDEPAKATRMARLDIDTDKVH